MYFAVLGIFRANLDGSEIEELTPLESFAIASLGFGIGIALDAERDTMYLVFGDLARVDLDGSNFEILLPMIEARAFGGVALDLRKPIPAVSEWGIVVLALILLSAGGGILRQRALTAPP